jgi:predicted TIM-barrel fold metal-dependent hydrolase
MTTRSAGTFGETLDCHAHINPESYVAAVTALLEHDSALSDTVALFEVGSRRFPLAYGKVQERIAIMDASGVQTQFLSMASPYPSTSSPETAAKVCEAWNDAAIELADTYPGRFRVMLALPLPDVAAALAEIERVGSHSAVAGILMNTHVAGLPLDDPSLLAFYGQLDRDGVVVFLHPDGFCVKGLLEDDLNWDIGTQLDDTIAVTRLIYGQIAEKFPRVRWIVPHLGGALPFLLERLDEHWRRDRGRRSLPSEPSGCLQNLLFDTAGHGPAAISFALSLLGPEHVVFGSDFPMVAVDDLPGTVRKVAQCADADGRSADVLSGNLTRTFSDA